MAEQDKQRETEFFDKFDREGGYDRFGEVSYASVLSLIKDTINPKPGEVVIDMGCGTGALTKQVADAFPGTRVMGLDLSTGCINRARRLYPELQFQVADAEQTTLPDSSVDVICYFGILHHFPDFSKVAAEGYRLLKPGGRFFSFDPHHHNPAFWLYRAHESPFYSPVGVTPNERLIRKSELLANFKKYGFQVNARVMSGIKFTHVESAKAQKFLWLYNLLDGILARTPLARVIGAWVVGWGTKG